MPRVGRPGASICIMHLRDDVKFSNHLTIMIRFEKEKRKTHKGKKKVTETLGCQENKANKWHARQPRMRKKISGKFINHAIYIHYIYESARKQLFEGEVC